MAIARKMTVRDFEAYIAQQKKPRSPAKRKMVIRDHRLFVNAVLNTVKDLKSAGVAASAKWWKRKTRWTWSLRCRAFGCGSGK